MSKYNFDLDYVILDIDISREEFEEIKTEADKIISENNENNENLAVAYLKKVQCLQKIDEINEYTGNEEPDEYKNIVNKMEQIKKLIEKALELYPDMPEALMQMGKMYHKTSAFVEGNIEKAINMYTKAIELKTDYAAAYNNLGILYASETYSHAKNNNLQDSLNKAINEYTKAIRIRLTDAAYYLNRGGSYSKMGNHEKAVDDFSSAIHYGSEKFKQMTFIFYLRGDEYLWLRNYEKAIDDLSESMRLSPAHIKSLLMRGNAYLGAGERDKAKADLDEYLRRKRLLK